MWRWLFGGPPKDEAETARLLGEARWHKRASRFQTSEDGRQYVIDLLVEVCLEADVCLSAPVAQHLAYICRELFAAEVFAFDLDTISPVLETLDAGVKLREQLRTCIKVWSAEEHYLSLWRAKLKIILLGVLDALPPNALSDPGPDGRLPHESVLRPETPMHALMDEVPTLLSKLIGTFSDDDVFDTPLFAAMRRQFEKRLAVSSGIAWEERYTSKRKWLMPWDRGDLATAELVSLYTDDTLFADFFATLVPIPIPDEVRFEHTHIVGGTGHGKTQLLQYLIGDDLERALEARVSLVILDPDGTLIRTIAQTTLFRDNALGDRTIIIDPTDSERPVALNLFDVSQTATADSRTRETIENNTIELFEYFFDALLGSELTGRQSTLFRYLGLLLMRIPDGNIHTLRELMEDGRQYRSYMEALDGSARTFFATRFFDKSLNQTKQQVLSRLWGVLSNRSLDRVFSATRNSVNLDHALQAGKIILVHTAKESLGEEGSAVFARMIVALLGQSLMRRAAIPAGERTPTYIYLDEAEGVVDTTLVRLLAQVRKYKGAITIAHQHLDQLSASARSGILANTSIKLAGGVSAKDASALAPEYRTKPEFILAQRKAERTSAFALFARNITPAAMTFQVPLGFVERLPRLSAAEAARLLERSRQLYGETPALPSPVAARVADEPVEPPPAPATPPPPQAPVETLPIAASAPLPLPRKEGGGGEHHREIQAMIKELGEAAGFRVSVEEVILDGEGRVDVILRRAGYTICCEVSVTTTKEHELLNVQKCLRFGADEVWLVVNSEAKKTAAHRFMVPQLAEAERPKFAVRTINDVQLAFADLGLPEADSGQIVRGYLVRSKKSQAVRTFLTRSLDALD